MPWTMNDYPSSLKNFNPTMKKKAIDIANALVEEGYDEDRAIPIATKQAEEWYDNAGAKERSDYLKKGKPREHNPEYPSRPELLDKAELVVPHEDKWAVQSKNAKKASKVFRLKNDAIDHGKSIARNKGTQLAVHRKDGTHEKTHDYSEI